MSDPASFAPGGGFETGRLSFEVRPVTGGFRSDARFAPPSELAPAPATETEAPAPEPSPPKEDPIAIAYAEGYTAGAMEAQARAEAQAHAEAAAREGLALAITRLDKELEEELRQRLRDTVAALCETAIAPLAIDEAALIHRIERAVSLLARVDDDRVIRLHPDDIALLSPTFSADWEILPDRTLERGGLRVETQNGGVEDSPELWRRAIAEALRQC